MVRTKCTENVRILRCVIAIAIAIADSTLRTPEIARGAGARPPPRGGPWKPLRRVSVSRVGVCDCGDPYLRYCMVTCSGSRLVCLMSLVPC